MPLAPGTRLGPYEIAGPLGAGGMGEVYRARDTRLGRDVAVKVLPQHLSANSEARARFEREARAVSSLNHPHICTLHDVGRAPGEAGAGETDYLVMELVEGETLAERLARGALPAAEVLRLGAQVAEALGRAHRAGVVHRDLKPGNVMLTKSGAKLMDFGLARAGGPAAGPPDDRGATGASAAKDPSRSSMTQSPTAAQPLTAEGTIVGTFLYMAPEQLEGREADARGDIWALGCVLYEMATGRRAFTGATQASLIGSIMRDTPRPIAELAAMTPPALERLVRRCLEKDPDDRWQSARDVAHELQWIAEGGSQAGVPAPVSARRRHRERLAWGLAAVALGAALALGWFALEPRLRKPDVIQAVVDPPAGARLNPYASNVVISPDGASIAFVALDSAGVASLWVRPLDADIARRLPGASGQWPFWSPDGKYLAYFDLIGGKLMKVAVAGGSPSTLCNSQNGRGGSWNRDGTILFAPNPEGPLVRIAAGGGEPQAVTALDSSRHESAHRFPCFLPDGDHFLFATLPARPGGWEIYAGSLRSRDVKRIMTAGSAPVYVEPGYLLFEREGRVMAQRFDAGRLALAGDAIALAEAPGRADLDAEPIASASRNGRLAMLRTAPLETRLEVVDRTGATRSVFDLPRAPWAVAGVAPDARRAALFNGRDIWVVDLARSVPMLFANTTASQPSAAWSPDGDRIAFVTNHEGREEVHIAGLDGRAEPVPTTEDAYKVVSDWSSDGRFVVFCSLNSASSWDIWMLPLEGERTPAPYLAGPSWEFNCRLSPDGRWLAYQSDESGSHEVYVQSFPRPGRKVRVSPDGGANPSWSRGGRELQYNRGNTRFAVSVEAGDDFRPGTPRPLFTIRAAVTSAGGFPDGERVLASVATESRANDIRLILDWKALLGR